MTSDVGRVAFGRRRLRVPQSTCRSNLVPTHVQRAQDGLRQGFASHPRDITLLFDHPIAGNCTSIEALAQDDETSLDKRCAPTPARELLQEEELRGPRGARKRYLRKGCGEPSQSRPAVIGLLMGFAFHLTARYLERPPGASGARRTRGCARRQLRTVLAQFHQEIALPITISIAYHAERPQEGRSAQADPEEKGQGE